MDEEQIIVFETKIAHNEMAIELLQESVFEQQKTIETLKKQLEKLAGRIDGLQSSELEIGPADEKPPHY